MQSPMHVVHSFRRAQLHARWPMWAAAKRGETTWGPTSFEPAFRAWAHERGVRRVEYAYVLISAAPVPLVPPHAPDTDCNDEFAWSDDRRWLADEGATDLLHMKHEWLPVAGANAAYWWQRRCDATR